MTPKEHALIAALGRCSMISGTRKAAFVRNMQANATLDESRRLARDDGLTAEDAPLVELTPKQRKYLLQLAIYFRRQIPNLSDLLFGMPPDPNVEWVNRQIEKSLIELLSEPPSHPNARCVTITVQAVLFPEDEKCQP